MLFYTIFFIFFQAAFYFCVGSFIIFILGMICGLVKSEDLKLVYRACLVTIVLAPLCRFMADQLKRKINQLRLKGGD